LFAGTIVWGLNWTSKVRDDDWSPPRLSAARADTEAAPARARNRTEPAAIETVLRLKSSRCRATSIAAR
jgi:hypothetical protein